MSVSSKECKALEEKGLDEKLYYNPKFNNVFTDSGLTKRMIWIGSIPTIFMLLFWFIPGLKKHL